jgi:hypothetical protein
MFRVYHNRSFKSLIPPLFSTQNHECVRHGTIGREEVYEPTIIFSALS